MVSKGEKGAVHMRFWKFSQAVLVLGMVTWSPMAALAADTPEALVAEFYQAKIDWLTGIRAPAQDRQTNLGPYLTASLIRQLTLRNRLDEELMYFPDEGPILEGDTFSSVGEGITGQEGTTCKVHSKKAKCWTTLTYGEGHSPSRIRWQDSQNLFLTAQGWRIDDIGFQPSREFIQHGTLRKNLNRNISELRAMIARHKAHSPKP